MRTAVHGAGGAPAFPHSPRDEPAASYKYRRELLSVHVQTALRVVARAEVMALRRQTCVRMLASGAALLRFHDSMSSYPTLRTYTRYANALALSANVPKGGNAGRTLRGTIQQLCTRWCRVASECSWSSSALLRGVIYGQAAFPRPGAADHRRPSRAVWLLGSRFFVATVYIPGHLQPFELVKNVPPELAKLCGTSRRSARPRRTSTSTRGTLASPTFTGGSATCSPT